MTVKVLVCDPIDREGIEMLKKAGLKVDIKKKISKEELKRIVADYEVLIVRSRTKITSEVIDSAKRLRIIGRAGSGLDNIDIEYAKDRGIEVLNTPEPISTAVAELTIGLMISLARRIPYADQSMKRGEWLKGRLKGCQLKGKTLGLVGFGNIGVKVAEIAKALGMKILVNKRTLPTVKDSDVEFVSLHSLLRRSDFISLHVPLSNETAKMIGEKEIGMMKKGAYLINTSRGAVVDEKALLKALKDGKLSGAALDVFEVEPPDNMELIKMENVICTPHIGAQTAEAQREASIEIAEKIIDRLKSKGLISSKSSSQP